MTEKKVSSANNDISVEAARKTLSAKTLVSLPKDVKQRWIYAGAGVAVAIAAATTLMQSNKAPTTVAKKTSAPASVDTTPKGLNSQVDWRAQTGADVQALRKSLQESQATQKELLARVEALRQEVATVKQNPAGATGSGGNKANRIDFNLPPPPEAPGARPGAAPAVPILAPPQVGVTPRAGQGGEAGAVQPPATTPAAQGAAPSATPPAQPKRIGAKGFVPEGAGAEAVAAEANKATTLRKMVVNEKQGFLPAGSFSAATLISGVEAFTGGTAQSQPQPIVIRLDENAILPNNAGYQIKGCHILASVYGDMSSERVFGRTSTLTCVDVNDKLVLSEEVEGNLIDSDGKNGIRGQLQDRQGAKLARSLLAGFAQGMASAFGSAQTTSVAGAGGVTTALTGSSIQAAGYGGASKATQQLADFYLKQAEATMPVIAVDAGRKISVLFTKSKSLKFESVTTYRVQPESSLTVERPAGK